MTGPVITVEGLCRRFGAFEAVKEVTFEVARGEIFGYLGANGAGKSTTIRMLCGLLAPTAGRIMVAGIDVKRHPHDARRRIGYMSQKFSLYPDLSVQENLEFFGGAYGLRGATLRERIGTVLQEVGLEAVRNAITGSLAGGWAQRVALANALLHEPEILFLDEPTAGVDPASRRNFLALVRARVARGATVFLTTHYMEEAEYCTRVGIMVDGRLRALDTPTRLKQQLVDGDLLMAWTRRPRELAAALRGHVLDLQPLGNGLRLRVARDKTLHEGLMGLVRHVDPSAVVEPSEPTLEDVFRAAVGTVEEGA